MFDFDFISDSSINNFQPQTNSAIQNCFLRLNTVVWQNIVDENMIIFTLSKISSLLVSIEKPRMRTLFVTTVSGWQSLFSHCYQYNPKILLNEDILNLSVGLFEIMSKRCNDLVNKESGR